MNVRWLLGLGILFFIISIGVGAAARLESDTIMGVLGLLCGLATGTPFAFLLGYLIGRRRNQQHENPAMRSPYGGGQYPPVVIVSPEKQALQQYLPYLPPGEMDVLPAQRRFTSIIGDDDA